MSKDKSFQDFVPYEQSLVLRELGFNEPCFGFYIELRNPQEGILTIDKCENNINGVLAPTFSQAFRWFREKYKLSGTPQYFISGYYCYTINDMKNIKESNRLFTEFETYEEAEIECLKKLIEIVNKNTNG